MRGDMESAQTGEHQMPTLLDGAAMKLCLVADCEDARHALGRCRRHYNRLYRQRYRIYGKEAVTPNFFRGTPYLERGRANAHAPISVGGGASQSRDRQAAHLEKSAHRS